jgi:radical SAM protein with 4Fe4S-binding SPASM domain
MGYENELIFGRILDGLKIISKYSNFKRVLNLIKVLFSYYLMGNKIYGLPLLIKVEPTNLCDIECSLCPRKSIKYGFGLLEMEKFKEVINYFSPHSYFVFLHLWGESVLHKQLGEMIHYVREKKMCTYLSANFNNIKEERILQDLVDSKLDYLTISLDGIDQESYSKYRTGGNFEKVLSNIRKLILYKKKVKSKYPKIILQFILMKHNQHDIENVKNLARELQVDSLDIKTLDAKPVFYGDKQEDFIPTNDKMKRKIYSGGKKNKKKRRKCFWLYGTTHITWNGKIMPCCVRVFDDEFGDFSPYTFETLWKSGNVNRLRQNLWKQENITDKDCLKCDFLEGQGFLT